MVKEDTGLIEFVRVFGGKKKLVLNLKGEVPKYSVEGISFIPRGNMSSSNPNDLMRGNVCHCEYTYTVDLTIT